MTSFVSIQAYVIGDFITFETGLYPWPNFPGFNILLTQNDTYMMSPKTDITLNGLPESGNVFYLIAN